MLTVLTLIAASSVSLAATSTGQTEARTLVVTKTHRVQACNNTKPYISTKRHRTWYWQDSTFIPRTRTAFAEKHTHGCKYLKWIGKRWAGRADETFRRYVELQDPQEAICHVFGVYCSEALRVASCESGHSYSVHAHNGQYLGMFQMDSSARAIYGHGPTALEQARAAYAYFVASGSEWSPWSCRP